MTLTNKDIHDLLFYWVLLGMLIASVVIVATIIRFALDGKHIINNWLTNRREGLMRSQRLLRSEVTYTTIDTCRRLVRSAAGRPEDREVVELIDSLIRNHFSLDE